MEGERLVAGLDFPTGVTCGDDGDLYVAESGLPSGGAAPGGRVWRLAAGDRRHLVAEGLDPPMNWSLHRVAAPPSTGRSTWYGTASAASSRWWTSGASRWTPTGARAPSGGAGHYGD